MSEGNKKVIVVTDVKHFFLVTLMGEHYPEFLECPQTDVRHSGSVPWSGHWAAQGTPSN